MRQIQDLKANPSNPRTITDAKAAMLQRSLTKFGDLGGIVFNRARGRLIGGHQRIEAFKAAQAKVTIERTYDAPTKTGTVAEGYVDIDGERFAYREVDWPDEHFERAANLSANKSAGEWNLPEVASWLDQMKQANFSLDLTMFDEVEQKALSYDLRTAIADVTHSESAPSVEHSEADETPSDDGGGAPAEVDLSRFSNFDCECPRCGFHFDATTKGQN